MDNQSKLLTDAVKNKAASKGRVSKSSKVPNMAAAFGVGSSRTDEIGTGNLEASLKQTEVKRRDERMGVSKSTSSTKSTDSTKQKCTVCRMAFDGPSTLSKHMDVHYNGKFQASSDESSQE